LYLSIIPEFILPNFSDNINYTDCAKTNKNTFPIDPWIIVIPVWTPDRLIPHEREKNLAFLLKNRSFLSGGQTGTPSPAMPS
jgi:hypothetical protein